MSLNDLNGTIDRSVIEIYTDELQFLITLKQSIGILNNRIHDKLALIAIEKLKALHPTLNFEYRGAGAGGIDVVGRARSGVRKLIAEVKTTHTSEAIGIRGPQKRAIERDLQRLSDEPGNLRRYLIVISKQTKSAVEKQIKPHDRFPKVTVLDAIGMVGFIQPNQVED